MKTFKLIIFDCDGVLVDSEVITNRVLRDMLGELGAEVTLEFLFEHFVGHSMEHCLGLIRLLINREPPWDFEDRYRERTARALASDLEAVPGIRQALHHLRVPYCVASNGSHEKMRATLGLTGLLDGFQGRMFSADDVALPKPAPNLFLLAASTLGVAPEDALVIEDTPVGVLAGRSAGMSTFGFARRTPGHRLRAAGASVVFTDMAELPGLLGGRSVEAGLVYAL